MTEIEEIIPLIEYDIEEGNHISWYHAKVLLDHINSLITTIESLQNDLRVANDWESDALSWRDFCNDRDNVSEDEFTEDNFALIKSELYELRMNYDHFNKCLKENDALIESQKEEIERLRSAIMQGEPVTQDPQRCKHGLNINLFCVRCEEALQEGDK